MKSVAGERCTSNSDEHRLEWVVKKSKFKNLEELLKKWTEAAVCGIKSHHAQMS